MASHAGFRSGRNPARMRNFWSHVSFLGTGMKTLMLPSGSAKVKQHKYVSMTLIAVASVCWHDTVSFSLSLLAWHHEIGTVLSSHSFSCLDCVWWSLKILSWRNYRENFPQSSLKSVILLASSVGFPPSAFVLIIWCFVALFPYSEKFFDRQAVKWSAERRRSLTGALNLLLR